MTFISIILLFLAGIASGVINAVAGGGTFITFGVLTLFGVPPVMANASSSIIQFPGYVSSTHAYKSEIAKFWRQALMLLLVSGIGALIGAVVLLTIDNPAFRAIVPWLLLGATLIFAAGPVIKRWQAKQAGGADRRGLGYVLQFLTAIYGGFFGAGMGIMMLATLSLTESDDYHRLNAYKNLISVLIASIAIAIFTTGGLISWREVIVMAPGAAIGGYLGVWTARRVPQNVMRIFVIVIGLALTAYYFAS
ncbi:MAG: sulfite exporter TauE/SafE family protein [Paracoccaceae bacterium]